MKIKIAICLSGEPRLSHKAIHSINDIRDKWSNQIDIDIFYHLWDNITKRQKQINEDPIIEKTNENYLNDMLKPTVGLIESKDILDEEIPHIINYTKKVIQENSEQNTFKENELSINLLDPTKLERQLKYTNWPWYSQMYSLSKSHILRTEYEKKYNITYDFVLRSRTDVQIFLNRLNRLYNIIEDRQKEPDKMLYYKIHFPSMYLKGRKRIHNRKKFKQINAFHEHTYCATHVEYCFFTGCSKSLNEDCFINYKNDILDYMIRAKHGPDKFLIYQPTSHTYMPYVILKHNHNVEIRCGDIGFKYKLEQLPKLF